MGSLGHRKCGSKHMDPSVDPTVDPSVDPRVDPCVDPIVVPSVDPNAKQVEFQFQASGFCLSFASLLLGARLRALHVCRWLGVRSLL